MSDLDFHDGSGREGATAVIGVAPRLVGCIISNIAVESATIRL